MKYLPIENITYQTKLDYEEVLNRLNKVVEPVKNIVEGEFFKKEHLLKSEDKPYKGSINGNSFSISRIVYARKPFLPRISGVIQKDSNGTKVNIKMRLHSFIMIFCGIWFWFTGAFAYAFIKLPLIYNGDLDGISRLLSLIPIGMLILLYAIMVHLFRNESTVSKKYFAQLFEAEIKK